MRQLYDHQLVALNQLRYSLGRKLTRPVLQAPCGFGKTVLASAIVTSAREKNKRVCFVVPALSLIDQTVKSFWDDGIREVGVIQADHPMTDYSKPIQVASVQTLARREPPQTDLVIVDEVHNQFKIITKWIEQKPDLPFVGLSATPWSKGLGKSFTNLIIASTTQGLIDQGFLSPFEVWAPSEPDLSKCRTLAGDYHEVDLGEIMDEPALTADIVATWRQKGTGNKTLCFAVNRAHARHLQDKFNRAGINCGYIDAYTKPIERERISKAFHAGEFKVVVNVGCLTTGVDWDVRCIILARPTKSEILFTQIIGRGLRTASGKDKCVILDHSNSHQRLGFVTDIHHTKLDMGKRKTGKGGDQERKPSLPKTCASKTCDFVKPAGVHTCPACGFSPAKREEIETQDGVLGQFKGNGKPGKIFSQTEKAEIYSQLKYYQQSRGFKEGWLSHQYKQKTGVWPINLKSAPAKKPTPAMLGWIRHRQIAYAKSHKKQGGMVNAA